MRIFRSLTVLIILSCTFSCATYYQINQEFNDRFEQGNLEAAEKVLDQNKKAGRKKAKFLYYANQGVVNAMLGDLKESNKWFEKAYLFGEDYHQNAANLAASFLTNPNSMVYPGEDHEHLLVLYYKALNFLKMEDYESALVECRRLINRLNVLSDKYKSDNKYSEDAFIHNLMGIIYEASGDISNAFVAYRNAYNIYQDEYQRLFNQGAPDQLKEDLLRAAYLNGYMNDLDYFEKQFDRKYKPKPGGPELVFFWHNGLGPVKDEWSINFTTIDGGDGMVTFVNEDYGFNFPFQINDAQRKNELTDLRMLRIAFPKYVERNTYYKRAVIQAGGQRHQLELVEDVNQIAFKTLQERMSKEFAKGLLRAGIKKTMEMAIRGDSGSDDDDEKSKEEKQEEALRAGLSMMVGLMNAVTEKADTRNWQTIPHSIYYSRVPMDQGANTVVLKTITATGATDQVDFQFEVSGNQTIFHSYHSLEYSKR